MDNLPGNLPDELPQLIGAACVLFIGFLIITKVTQLIMKVGIVIIIIAIIAVLFRDQLPA